MNLNGDFKSSLCEILIFFSSYNLKNIFLAVTRFKSYEIEKFKSMTWWLHNHYNNIRCTSFLNEKFMNIIFHEIAFNHTMLLCMLSLSIVFLMKYFEGKKIWKKKKNFKSFFKNKFSFVEKSLERKMHEKEKNFL